MKLPFTLYKVLVTGDREGFDQNVIDEDMANLREYQKAHPKIQVVIICGGAPGVDTQCELSAHAHNLHTLRVAALWKTRYRSAGPQRNSIMAAIGPEECYAYHNDIQHSRGTRDMIKTCLAQNIEVHARGFDLEDVTKRRGHASSR